MKGLKKFMFVALLTSIVMGSVGHGNHSGSVVGIFKDIDDPIIGHH
ncbi:hypothetical protein RKD55_003554 [Rossellomorea marisflavi]